MTDVLEREANVGETRWRARRDGRPIGLGVERWSEAGARVSLGERHAGRVLRVDWGLGGAFVDLGVGPPGFLSFRRGRPRPKSVIEGGAIVVDVRAEAYADKGPRLALAPGAPNGPTPRRLSAAEPRAMFGLAADAALVEAGPGDFDASFDEALSATAGLAGGGRLWIEPTRALIAIDVDLAERGGAADRGRRTRDLALAAVEGAARALALRSLAGLVAIDLPDLDASEREAVAARFVGTAAACALKVEAAPINRFGVLMATIARGRRPLAEGVFDAAGRPSPETIALQGLRALERAGRARRGDRLALRLGRPAAAWLEADTIGWRAAMVERLGARFIVEGVDGRDELVQVYTP